MSDINYRGEMNRSFNMGGKIGNKTTLFFYYSF